MQSLFRVVLLSLISMQTGVVAFSQAATNPHPSHPWKRYCQPNGGFCFKYPPTWKMLGEIYDGNGVVIAPVQKDEQPLWDEVTVAMVAPPSEEGGMGLNGVIEEAAKGMREAGQDFQTLRRQESTVDAKPSELLKAQYREKSTGRDWIEELVFIQGPDNEIYSVALKTSPQNAARLEPVFTGILRTWTLPEPEPPAAVDESDPDKTAPGNQTPTETQPHQP
ncbi:MAG TPA: hypothetical protein VGG15_12610 [Terriglobales bacterium]|jgi:hypothetical protein